MLEIKRIERQNLKGESRAVKRGGKLVKSCKNQSEKMTSPIYSYKPRHI